MTEKEIHVLASKFLQGMATREEEALLHTWYETKGYSGEKITVKTDGEQAEDVKKRLFENIHSAITKPTTNGRSRRWNPKWISYAAAIFLFVSFGIYFYINNSTEKDIHYTKLLKDDVGPGGNNAVLELQNGKKINLDEAQVGGVVELNGMTVKKSADGVLAIDASSNPTNSKTQYNTIRTPRGGQYQLKLPDGTHVWLNASSSIKFPSVFSESIREVELTGEAYFEVTTFQDAKQGSIPFIVKTFEQEVAVLGTSFNISSYSNEQAVRTTLLEGAVRVSMAGSSSSRLLLPGQESIVQQGTLNVQKADIESIIAWKNGDFIFNQEDLHSIMKKIERWYDVDVVYQGTEKGRTFTGAIARSRNLSDVLQIMEMTGQVTFKIEGRRVFVMT